RLNHDKNSARPSLSAGRNLDRARDKLRAVFGNGDQRRTLSFRRFECSPGKLLCSNDRTDGTSLACVSSGHWAGAALWISSSRSLRASEWAPFQRLQVIARSLREGNCRGSELG